MSAASARGVAADVAAGRMTATASVKTALDAVTRLDPVLKAFTLVRAEAALAEARALDAALADGAAAPALAGVPFAVKNLFDIEGVTTLAGSIVRREGPAAPRDAELVSRLRSAGAILIGALNMDEFAYGFVTENAHYGATRNPHDPQRICGGSSGGSAAAVAAGIVPLALGTDTNGSIRVPAALCGVFGLKPTFGRLSRDGVFPFVDSLDHAGPFARSACDLALAYDVLGQGGETAPLTPGLEAASRAPLRVGVLGGWFTQGAFPEVLDGLERAIGALRTQAGVSLSAMDLPGAEAARSAAFCLTAHEGGRLHAAELSDRAGHYDPAVRDRLLAGTRVPEALAAAAQAFRLGFRAEVRKAFEQVDVLIAPATPCPAPRIGEATMWLEGREVSVRRNLGAYTQPISFVGLPVVSAPLDRPPAALPLGLQLIAPAWREDLALALARRLERLGVARAHPPVIFAA